MDEAEEACSQALNRRPSCAKALFRRGQARLALGRPIEAASDFGEVCLLEPNNAEVAKMLHLSRGGETDPTPSTVAPSSHGSESRISVAAALSYRKDGKPLPSEAAETGSSGSIGDMEDAKLEQGETRSGANHHRVNAPCTPSSSPSAPSFMVPGWLTSAERERGKQLLENDARHLDDCDNQDRSKTGQSGGVESVVSVTKLVNQLSLSSHNMAASAKTEQESQRASGTTEAVQAEWLSLQAEENTRVLKTHASVKELQEKAKKKRRRKKKSAKYGQKGRGPTEAAIQTSQWWESLEEEENKVRQAFRARLSVGGKLSTKVKKEKANP